MHREPRDQRAIRNQNIKLSTPLSPAFVDLHLHLLPGVDDGPRDEAESIELARQLVADGVSRCTVTPHFNAWDSRDLSSIDEVRPRLADLQENLRRHEIPLEVHAGAEHFLTPELIVQVQQGKAPFLGPGPYMLVELPFDNRPLYAEDLLYQLQLLQVTPVLAHPARYNWVEANPGAIQKFVDSGVVLQCTAGSIGGQYGTRVQRAAEHILSNGWYSLPGTDLHHPGQPRSLSAMHARIGELAGDVAANILMVQNPDRVLSGAALLPVPAAEEPEPERRRFRFFG